MSDNPVDLTKFRAAIEERRRKQAEITKQTEQPDISHDDDLIPEAPYERSEDDKELDRVLNRIGIVDAYTRWCGKSEVKIRGSQTEGIKVSCPVPGHADRNPSAWLNTEKGTWFCAACNVGGDSYDIAAYHFGISDYKSGANFHELRRKMAGSFGFTFITPPGVSHPIPVPPSDPEGEGGEVQSESLPEGERDGASASVTSIAPLDDSEPEIEFPVLDWEKIIDPDTFLGHYMECCKVDDIAEEYHFWNGLLAIGFALGRDVVLNDSVPVLGNLFVCLLGHSGDGKSKSFSHAQKLLAKALPHRWDDPNSKGVHIIDSPASAEVLIHNFSKPVLDPTDPKRISYYASVRGLVEFNELSSLTGRTSRVGNVLKPTLMNFYDGSPVIMTSSITSGKKEAWNPFASVFTTTQPKALRDLMKQSDIDSGFLNRWIFASGRAKERLAFGDINVDIDPAVKPLQDIQGWGGFGKNLTVDKDALDLITEFFKTVLFPMQKRDESRLLIRLDLTFKKLLLLFSANKHQDSVTLETAEQIIKMFDYLVMSYNVPAKYVGSSLQIEIRDEILRHAERYTKSKGGITLRELNHCMKRKNYPPSMVHTMIKILTDMGELFAETTSTGGKNGRTTVRYKHVG